MDLDFENSDWLMQSSVVLDLEREREKVVFFIAMHDIPLICGVLFSVNRYNVNYMLAFKNDDFLTNKMESN